MKVQDTPVKVSAVEAVMAVRRRGWRLYQGQGAAWAPIRPPVSGKPGGSGNEVATPAIKWEPMPMRSEYRALLDAGYVLNEDFEPVQQFLMNTVEHHEWRNPSDKSSVRLTIPQQQRYVVPAGYDNDDTWSARHKV